MGCPRWFAKHVRADVLEVPVIAKTQRAAGGRQLSHEISSQLARLCHPSIHRRPTDILGVRLILHLEIAIPHPKPAPQRSQPQNPQCNH